MEAKKRGLPNLKNSPEALAELVTKDNRAFLAKTKVFSEGENEARYHVKLERYIKDIEIEVEALRGIVSAYVLPAAYKQAALLAGAGSGKAVKGALEKINGAIDDLTARVNDLHSATEKASAEGLEKKAKLFAETVFPGMAAVREVADAIEDAVSDEFWPLPKYREMLLLI